jgi:hypothetical protein
VDNMDFFNHEDKRNIKWLLEQGFKSKFVKTRIRRDCKVTAKFSKRGVRFEIESGKYSDSSIERLTRGRHTTINPANVKVFIMQETGGYRVVRNIKINKLANFEKFVDDFVEIGETAKKDPNHKPKKIESREFEDDNKPPAVLTVENGQFSVYHIEDGEIIKDSYAHDKIKHLWQSFNPGISMKVVAIASRDGKRLYGSKNSEPDKEPFFVLRHSDHYIAMKIGDDNTYYEVTSLSYKYEKFNLIVDSKKPLLSKTVRDIAKIMIFRFVEGESNG